MRADMARHLNLLALEGVFRERHPDAGRHLVHRGPREDGTPEKLTLDTGTTGRVEIMWVRVDHPGTSRVCWMISSSVEGDQGVLWDTGTPLEVLADAFHEKALAVTEGRQETSPWRWAEAEASDIVRLADALTSRGVTVDYAMADNRLRVVFGAHGYEFRRHLGEGHLLLVRVADRRLWVYRRPELGWLADVHAPSQRRVWRVDLNAQLFGSAGTAPGVPADRVSVDELAGALVGVVKELRDAPTPATALYSGDGTIHGSTEAMLPPQAVGRSVDPENPCALAAAQLNAFGFGDVHFSVDGTELVSAEYQVVWWLRERSLGLPDLKRLFADAAVQGKLLLVLARHGLTGPAEEFADRSRSFAFSFDPRRARVFNGNRLASEAGFTHDYQLAR